MWNKSLKKLNVLNSGVGRNKVEHVIYGVDDWRSFASLENDRQTKIANGVINIMSCFNQEKNNSFIKLVNKPSCISSIKPLPAVLSKCFVYLYSLGVRKDSVQVCVNNTICKAFLVLPSLKFSNLFYQFILSKQLLFPMLILWKLQPQLRTNTLTQALSMLLSVSLFLVLLILILSLLQWFLFWIFSHLNMPVMYLCLQS